MDRGARAATGPWLTFEISRVQEPKSLLVDDDDDVDVRSRRYVDWNGTAHRPIRRAPMIRSGLR